MMRAYRSRSGDSGVTGYEYGSDWIKLRFHGGKLYEYSSRRIGAENLETMKRLADSGEGLTTFVNTHPRVKEGYSR